MLEVINQRIFAALRCGAERSGPPSNLVHLLRETGLALISADSPGVEAMGGPLLVLRTNVRFRQPVVAATKHH